MNTGWFRNGLVGLVTVLTILAGREGTAAGPSGSRWAIVVSTAPQIPQDVWFSGQGSNSTGWNSGGVICLGNLAQGIPDGLHATLKVEIAQAGVLGPDGVPVPPGDYVAPGSELPPRPFTVTAGGTFFVILNTVVVESNIPFIPAGRVGQTMFTFDYDGELGRVDREFVGWNRQGNTFVPFLNEGLMMTNLRRLP
jgi:hypothetical protein